MRKIIFPTDFSETAENAFRYSLALCDDHPAKIDMLHVIIPDNEMVEIPTAGNLVTRAKMDLAKKSSEAFLEKTMVQVQTGHELTNIPNVNFEMEVGFPVSTIIEYSRREDADYIVMGTQGKHTRWDRLLGSVSTGVIENANIPVLVIPEDARYKDWKKVTIAVDLKQSDLWKIFKATNFIGNQMDKLDCVHFHPSNKTPKTQIEMFELEEYFKINPKSYSVGFHLVKGESMEASLNKFVEENESDLLVMVGPHATGINKILVQSATKKMAYMSKVPLLIFP